MLCASTTINPCHALLRTYILKFRFTSVLYTIPYGFHDKITFRVITMRRKYTPTNSVDKLLNWDTELATASYLNIDITENKSIFESNI